MATKNKPSNGNHQLFGNNHCDNDNHQYSNFNLNQNHKYLNVSLPVQLKSKSNNAQNFGSTIVKSPEGKKALQFSNKSSLQSWKSFNKNHSNKAEDAKMKWKNLGTSESTLSLHIAAYEDSAATVSANQNKSFCKNESKKQFLIDPKFEIQNPFEFPRQQENSNDKGLPEIAQFKASQKLFNPNETSVAATKSASTRTALETPLKSSTSQGSVLPSRSVSTTASTMTDLTQKDSTTILSPPKLSSCRDCPTSMSSASSIHPHHSVSNTYDPAVARLNLPKDVLANLEKLVSIKPKPASGDIDPNAPTHGMKIRFYTSLLVLASLGILGIVANSFGASGFSGALIAVLAVFSFHWYWVHGSGLSRHKKTYFNEQNVLDTYKVYDREFGHLFQKEPDTPGDAAAAAAGGCCGPPPKAGDPNVPIDPVQNVANDLLAQYKTPPKEKAEFSASVQDHYGNMYDNIRRINQEMDLMAKARQENAEAEKSSTIGSSKSNAAGAPNNDPLVPHAQASPLVPADIPLPGETKKKQ